MPSKDINKRREACRRHYQNHSEEVRDKVNVRRRERRKEINQFFWDYFLAHPCVECGEPDPIVLEFHHIDGEEKCFNISAARRSCMNLEKIKKEMEKCEVLCRNCHVRHTAKEFGWYGNILDNYSDVV